MSGWIQAAMQQNTIFFFSGKTFISMFRKHRGFSPYATFRTWKKFALAKYRISQILVIVLKNRSNEIHIRRELSVNALSRTQITILLESKLALDWLL